MKRVVLIILGIFLCGMLLYGVRIFIPGLPINSIPEAALQETPMMIYGSKLDTPTTPTGQIPIKDDPQLDNFYQSWLKKNRSGWTTDYNTFLPERVILCNKGRLMILLDTKLAVFAYPVFKDADMQITKDLTPEDIVAFKAEFNRLGIKTD